MWWGATNAASVFTAGIEFVDGVPQVTWAPNPNTNGIVRSYTISENLTDAAGIFPVSALWYNGVLKEKEET